MIINITGTADKRPIVYPLLYTANILGSVVLLTNDTDYCRLIGGERSGEIGNTFIDTEFGVSASDVDPTEYDFTVTVSCNESLFFDEGKVIKIISDGKERNSDEEIRIGFAPAGKKENAILITEKVLREIYEVEKQQKLLPTHHSIKRLSQIFAPVLEISLKECERLLKWKDRK